jgi:hypothetical protein
VISEAWLSKSPTLSGELAVAPLTSSRRRRFPGVGRVIGLVFAASIMMCAEADIGRLERGVTAYDALPTSSMTSIIIERAMSSTSQLK